MITFLTSHSLFYVIRYNDSCQHYLFESIVDEDKRDSYSWVSDTYLGTSLIYFD